MKARQITEIDVPSTLAPNRLLVPTDLSDESRKGLAYAGAFARQFRSRVYVASQDVWLTLDAGQFEEIKIDSRTGVIRAGLSPETRYLHAARLRIEQPGKTGGSAGYRPTKSFNEERGAYVVPLGKEAIWIELAARP